MESINVPGLDVNCNFFASIIDSFYFCVQIYNFFLIFLLRMYFFISTDFVDMWAGRLSVVMQRYNIGITPFVHNVRFDAIKCTKNENH